MQLKGLPRLKLFCLLLLLKSVSSFDRQTHFYERLQVCVKKFTKKRLIQLRKAHNSSVFYFFHKPKASFSLCLVSWFFAVIYTRNMEKSVQEIFAKVNKSLKQSK